MRAVNLIPSEQRAGASVGTGRSQGAVYYVFALLGGVALLALLYGIARHQVESRSSKAASLTAQAQRAQAETSQLAPYTSFVALRETRQQAVTQLVNSRFDWAHAFHELGRVLPFGVSLSSLSGTVGSSTIGSSAAAATPAASTASGAASSSVSSATPPGSVPVFTLSGCAVSQSMVAEVLSRLRLIDGVSEVTLQSSTKSSSGGGGALAAGRVAGGSGACPSGLPVFSVTVTFRALPASTATVSPGSGSVSTSAASSQGAVR